MQAKRSEMVYLLNCYYPIKELAAFYAPVYRYSHSFQYFVMQNYQKAKDVETFAQLGATAYPPSAVSSRIRSESPLINGC